MAAQGRLWHHEIVQVPFPYELPQYFSQVADDRLPVLSEQTATLLG
jgi:hypothetical protein